MLKRYTAAQNAACYEGYGMGLILGLFGGLLCGVTSCLVAAVLAKH